MRLNQSDLVAAMKELVDAVDNLLGGPHPEGLAKDVEYLARARRHVQSVSEMLANQEGMP